MVQRDKRCDKNRQLHPKCQIRDDPPAHLRPVHLGGPPGLRLGRMRRLLNLRSIFADLLRFVQYTAGHLAEKAWGVQLGDLQEDQDTYLHLDGDAAGADLSGQLDPARVHPLAGHDAGHRHHRPAAPIA